MKKKNKKTTNRYGDRSRNEKTLYVINNGKLRSSSPLHEDRIRLLATKSAVGESSTKPETAYLGHFACEGPSKFRVIANLCSLASAHVPTAIYPDL